MNAGIYSNAELDQFWNRILFSKHSDSTLQLLGKALSYSFISSNNPNYDADSPQDSGNPYNTLRIGLHDKLLNLTPLGFQMLLLHFLDTLVIFSHNVVYTFLHFFLYQLLSHSLSNFTKQYLLNII